MLSRLMMGFLVISHGFGEVDLNSAYRQGKEFALKKITNDHVKERLKPSDLEKKQAEPGRCVVSNKADFVQDCSSPKQELLVFISFSMPRESLRQLMMQAGAQTGVKVTFVLKGLKNNSFKDTLKELKELAVVTLNPTLFEDYQVSVVPTFVLVKHHQALQRLSGHVSVDFVLEKFGVVA